MSGVKCETLERRYSIPSLILYGDSILTVGGQHSSELVPCDASVSRWDYMPCVGMPVLLPRSTSRMRAKDIRPSPFVNMSDKLLADSI